MQPLSVNKAIADAHNLDGACVAIEGILTFETEDVSINHWPKAERREGYGSSIWIDPDGIVFGLDEGTLAKWSGKRVVVFGVPEASEESQVDGWENGFGHFGLWPVRIRARRIDLRKRWIQDHPAIETPNKTALSNPLPAPCRILRVATILNPYRRGAPGSGCQASTFAKKHFPTRQ